MNTRKTYLILLVIVLLGFGAGAVNLIQTIDREMNPEFGARTSCPPPLCGQDARTPKWTLELLA